MKTLNQIKVTKGRAEYEAIEWEPSAKFINLEERFDDHQHIIKNDKNPSFYTVEHFNGRISKDRVSDG